MSGMLAFCGLDCAECPAYIATQANDEEARKKTAEKWSKEYGPVFTAEDCICDGCLPVPGGRIGTYCGDCPMRTCNIQKGLAHCAQCGDYPCDNLSRFTAIAPMAKAKLEELRTAK